MQNDAGHAQSAAPATKTATYLAKTSQKYCACHTKRFSTRYKTRLNVTKCHACHAKRSNATFETSKMTPSAELTTGTAMRPSRKRLRTAASGCERLRNVERTYHQPPDAQSETGTLATHSGKMRSTFGRLGFKHFLAGTYPRSDNPLLGGTI